MADSSAVERAWQAQGLTPITHWLSRQPRGVRRPENRRWPSEPDPFLAPMGDPFRPAPCGSLLLSGLPGKGQTQKVYCSPNAPTTRSPICCVVSVACPGAATMGAIRCGPSTF